MSEDILVALITTCGVVATATSTVIAVMIGRTSTRVKSIERDAAQTREHVANSHTTNLREESDERHAALMAALDAVLANTRKEEKE